jgi:hypothetical protein
VTPTPRKATSRKRTSKAGVLHTPNTKTYAGVFDTKEQIAYTNIALDPEGARRRRGGYETSSDLNIVGHLDFVAWLNSKEGEERFIACKVVSAHQIQPSSGINKLYAKFLDERQDLRLASAIQDTRERFGFSLTQARNADQKYWRFTGDALTYVASVSAIAKVSPIEARNALYEDLKKDLGEFVDKLDFPTVEQVTGMEVQRYYR